MLLIGLTGGIASGKTLVSDAFAALGAPVVDADVLARKAVAPQSLGLISLVESFGESILHKDQSLNRAALRDIIFADPEKRQQVDSLLHPIIRSLSDEQIDAAKKLGHPYCVYAIPLLVETGQQDRFDRIVVVDVPAELQIERLIKRDNSSIEKAQAILAAQASREERLAIADDVIDNTGSKEETLKQVSLLHAAYLQQN